MDKTSRTEFRRTFLIEQLPEPLTRASEHLQYFDNYISNTRMRLRTMRDPATRSWTWILQQREPEEPDSLSVIKIAEIFLNEREHAQFEIFEGSEIRKNRYFHEFDGCQYSFDVYLGPLWGLNTAFVEFESTEEMAAFIPPPFIFSEVTDDRFFFGDELVEMNFSNVQQHLAAQEA